MGDVMVMEFLRRCLGWSVEDVATQAGVKLAKLRLVWAGKAAANDQELRAIARALLWNEEKRFLLPCIIDGDAALERHRRHATAKLNEFIDSLMGGVDGTD